jgi:hypothetical protein
MISPELISSLNLVSIICMCLAVICIVAVAVIYFKFPPNQMLAIITRAKIEADPKHRKAVLQTEPEESDALRQLFQLPSNTALSGWFGTVNASEAPPNSIRED